MKENKKERHTHTHKCTKCTIITICPASRLFHFQAVYQKHFVTMDPPAPLPSSTSINALSFCRVRGEALNLKPGYI